MTAIASGETQVIEDIGVGVELPGQPEKPETSRLLPLHDGIRSVMAIPIHTQGNKLGVVYLHARSSYGFNRNRIEIGEDLAILAGIALGNAYRYTDQVRKNSLLSRRIDTLSSLLEASSSIDPDQPLERSLQTIAAGICESTPFNIVLISVYDPANGNLIRTSSAGLTSEMMESLRSNQQSWSSLEGILDPKFKIGQAYFIPYEKMPILPADIHTLVPLPLHEYRGDGNTWHPEDMLLLPLYDKNGDPLGLISVDDPKDHLRPDLPSIESLEIFASQASLIITANRKIQSLNRDLESLRSIVGKSTTELEDHRQKIELLKTTVEEQTLALQSLNQQIGLRQAVSSIIRDIQKQDNRNAVFIALAQGLVRYLSIDVVFVAEVNGSGLRILHTVGKLPEGLRPEVHLGGRNPMLSACRTQEILNIPDATSHEHWKDSPFIRSTNAKGFVAIPIHDGISPTAVFLGLYKQRLPFPETEYVHQVSYLRQQVVFALKTINLSRDNQRRKNELSLLMDFNRQIGSFDPEHVFLTLIETARKAVPAADAGMVLQFTEDRRKILPIVSAGYSDPVELQKMAFLNRKSLIGKAVSTRKPQRKDEIDLRGDYRLTREELIRYQTITRGRIPSSVMIIPILASRDKQIEKGSPRIEGILLLESFQSSGSFSQDDEAMIASLAEQTALILANARLTKVSAERANQLRALTGIATAITANLQRHELVNSILDHLQAVLPFDRAALWLKEDNGLVLNATRGLESDLQGPRSPVNLLEHPHVVDILNSNHPFNRGIARPEENVELELSPDTQSWLGLPLITKGQLIGIISLEKNTPEAYQEDDIDLAMTFANQAAIALENSRLFDETLSLSVDLEKRVIERTRELEFEHHKTETLLRIITELTASLEMEKVLHRTLLVLNDMIGASHATCMVLQPGKTKLRHLATIGYPHPTPAGGWPSALEIDQGLVGWIIANRESVLINDVNDDERWLPLPGVEHKHRSAMGVPIELSGQLLGVLLLFHPEAGHFSADQLDLVNAAANQMAVAINNTELYDLIRSQTEELKNLLKNQKIEASRSRSILEAIAEGVLVTDHENRVTLFNDSAQRILSIKREHILGGSLDRLSGLFGPSANTWLETIYSWSSDPSSHHPGDTYSEQISLEDGRVLAVNLAPILNNDEFFGTVSIFHDITHQIEVDRLKSEFVATVSHELRTPMTSIKGYVDILLMGVAGELNEQQLRFLQVVKQNTERLTILVNDLLDLSRIEAGKAILSTQPLDLGYLIEEALAELENRSKDDQKSLSISAEIPSNLPRVIGDPERVRQILANLLNNAYHYTPQNGRIAVTAQRTGDEVRVDIADTGIGIPITEQERVFERFYRGENSLVLATSGTGLGLSIVQQLIHMHHGRIWLRSSGVPGEGSTFSFTLPIFEPSLPPEEEVEPWQESWSQKTNATSST
jgi:signal transduction histidine kinase